MTDPIKRGTKVTNGTLTDYGYVTPDVASLVRLASAALGRPVTADALSLARMARSEGIAQGELRMHIALNDLDDLGWSSVTYLLTYSTDPNRKGTYGSQFSPAFPDAGYDVKSVRRYATSKDPYTSDIELAEKVLRDRANGIDKANGAVKFLDKSSFGVQEGTGSADAKIAEWEGDGLQSFTVPGYGDDFVLFRKA